MRHPIQISTTPDVRTTEDGQQYSYLYVVALCDDGSMWTMSTENTSMWLPLPRIPGSESFSVDDFPNDLVL